MKHSKGNWVVGGKWRGNADPIPNCVLQDGDLIATCEETANAQRIVACVNMAEGVPTEQLNIIDLQGLIKAHDSVLDLLEIAIAERDKERAVKRELLEALKDVEKHIDNIHLKDFIIEAITSAEKENNNEATGL